ncbi:unnamed protein product, partial [Discosporangium mesarthrocarpum]
AGGGLGVGAGGEGDVTVRTSTKFIPRTDKGGRARWSEEFFFGQVSGDKAVRVTCIDKTLSDGGGEAVVGEALVPVCRLPENESIEQWYQLHPPPDSTATFTKAALRLRFFFTTSGAAAPAPAGAQDGSGAGTVAGAKAGAGDGTLQRGSQIVVRGKEVGREDSLEDAAGSAAEVAGGSGWGWNTSGGLGSSGGTGILNFFKGTREGLLGFSTEEAMGSGGGRPVATAAAGAPAMPRAVGAGGRGGSLERHGSSGGLSRTLLHPHQQVPLLQQYRSGVGEGQLPQLFMRDDGGGGAAAEAAMALSVDEVLPSGLVDYFLVVGPALDEHGRLQVADYADCGFGSSNVTNSAADNSSGSGRRGTVGPVTEVELECCVLEHFPEQQRLDAPFPTKVEWFCFPQGVFLVDSPTQPSPHVSSFVRFTAGVRSYGICLTFYRRVGVRGEVDGLPGWGEEGEEGGDEGPLGKGADEGRGGGGGAGDGRLWCPICLCVLTHIPVLEGLLQWLKLFYWCLRPKGVLQLFAAVLQEGRILLHSSKPALLAAVAEGMFALTYPLQWPYAYVPVLPRCLIEHVESPQPFILGVHTDWLKDISPDVLEELIVVDCDRGVVDGKCYEPLPPQIRRSLTKALRAVLHGGLGHLDRPERLPSGAETGGGDGEGGRSWRKTGARSGREIVEEGGSGGSSPSHSGGARNVRGKQTNQKGGEGSGEAGGSGGSEAGEESGWVWKSRDMVWQEHLEELLRKEFLRAMADMLYGFTDCLFFLHPDRPIFNGARFLQEYCEGEYVPFVSVVIDSLAFKFLLENQDLGPLQPFHEMLDQAKRDARKRGDHSKHPLGRIASAKEDLSGDRDGSEENGDPFAGAFPTGLGERPTSKREGGNRGSVRMRKKQQGSVVFAASPPPVSAFNPEDNGEDLGASRGKWDRVVGEAGAGGSGDVQVGGKEGEEVEEEEAEEQVRGQRQGETPGRDMGDAGSGLQLMGLGESSAIGAPGMGDELDSGGTRAGGGRGAQREGEQSWQTFSASRELALKAAWGAGQLGVQGGPVEEADEMDGGEEASVTGIGEAGPGPGPGTGAGMDGSDCYDSAGEWGSEGGHTGLAILRAPSKSGKATNRKSFDAAESLLAAEPGVTVLSEDVVGLGGGEVDLSPVIDSAAKGGIEAAEEVEESAPEPQLPVAVTSVSVAALAAKFGGDTKTAGVREGKAPGAGRGAERGLGRGVWGGRGDRVKQSAGESAMEVGPTPTAPGQGVSRVCAGGGQVGGGAGAGLTVKGVEEVKRVVSAPEVLLSPNGQGGGLRSSPQAAPSLEVENYTVLHRIYSTVQYLNGVERDVLPTPYTTLPTPFPTSDSCLCYLTLSMPSLTLLYPITMPFGGTTTGSSLRLPSGRRSSIGSHFGMTLPSARAGGVFDEPSLLVGEGRLRRKRSSIIDPSSPLEDSLGGSGLWPESTPVATPRPDAISSRGRDSGPVCVPLSMVDWSHKPILQLGHCELPEVREWTLGDISEEAGAGLAAAGAGDGEELDKDSEKLLQCLEAVFASDRMSEGDIGQVDVTLKTNPLVQDRFLQARLLTVLRGAGRRGGAGNRGPTQLQNPSFETLAQFSYTLLCVCVERKDYSVVHTLLQLTGAYYQVHEGGGGVPGQQKGGEPKRNSNGTLGKDSFNEGGYFTEFLSASISRHPIFTDMKFWQHVLLEAVKEKREKLAADQRNIMARTKTRRESTKAGEGKGEEKVCACPTSLCVHGVDAWGNWGLEGVKDNQAEVAPPLDPASNPAVTAEIVCRQVKVFLYEMAAIGMRSRTALRYLEVVSLQYKLPPEAQNRLQETVRLVWGTSSNM